MASFSFNNHNFRYLLYILHFKQNENNYNRKSA